MPLSLATLFFLALVLQLFHAQNYFMSLVFQEKI
jgi:hypothetical protein